MFRKVLVPLDGSALAEAALEPAMTLARQADGEVLFLRIPTPERILVPLAGTEGILWPDQSLAFSRKEAERYLTNLQKTWSSPAASRVPVRTAVMDGDVASVIVDTAAAEGTHLICMSTHGRSGLTRWVLGSTAEKVLSAAPCPVLIMRGRQPLRRIMITLDGSPLAEQALGPGFALAAAFGEKVILLRVIDEHLPASRHDLEHLERQERGLGRAQPDGSDLREITEAYLQRIARLQAQPGLEIQIDVTVGAAAESIIARIGALAVDAVVMATHGRTGLRRWVYGSVTEKVLDSAHCSLLVIRPDKAHLF